ncbi:hypothetical protein AB832_07955 [Flavobacteriaceae bacterium (ex Bugula neritina AB1)]|nr:hypothetical protein AB832_07955 [Flavobacteriaceae bacterium (ex Bugula neritina AB1)]
MKISDLRKIAAKRSSFMRKSESGLLSRAAILQKRLNNYVLNVLLPSLEVKDGRIVNSQKNIKAINKSKAVRRFFKEVVNISLYEYYDKQFRGLESRTESYFNEFNPSSRTIKQVTGKGKTLIDGVLNDLFDNNEVVRSIQNTIRAAISSNQRNTALRSTLTEQIKGKEDKLGLIQSYHYKNGYDKFQSYSRTLDEGFSKVLNLNYAIYAGGEIKTTRDFCEKRNGKVFNREEIMAWNNLSWQGKIEQGDVLINAGGYKCRHDYDWISYELAKRINPNINKSKFDKN